MKKYSNKRKLYKKKYKKRRTIKKQKAGNNSKMRIHTIGDSHSYNG